MCVCVQVGVLVNKLLLCVCASMSECIIMYMCVRQDHIVECLPTALSVMKMGQFQLTWLVSKHFSSQIY